MTDEELEDNDEATGIDPVRWQWFTFFAIWANFWANFFRAVSLFWDETRDRLMAHSFYRSEKRSEKEDKKSFADSVLADLERL